MKWSNPIPRKSPGEKRYDDITQAMLHTDQMLLDFLPEQTVDKVLEDVSARVQALGEGRENATTINTEARMIVATLTYASLKMMELEKGLLAKIADCLNKTGSGVSASLEGFQQKVKEGAIVDNGAFDTDLQWYEEDEQNRFIKNVACPATDMRRVMLVCCLLILVGFSGTGNVSARPAEDSGSGPLFGGQWSWVNNSSYQNSDLNSLPAIAEDYTATWCTNCVKVESALQELDDEGILQKYHFHRNNDHEDCLLYTSPSPRDQA